MTAFCLQMGTVCVCVRTHARTPVPAWGSGERYTMEENEHVAYEMSHWEDLQVLIQAN